LASNVAGWNPSHWAAAGLVWPEHRPVRTVMVTASAAPVVPPVLPPAPPPTVPPVSASPADMDISSSSDDADDMDFDAPFLPPPPATDLHSPRGFRRIHRTGPAAALRVASHNVSALSSPAAVRSLVLHWLASDIHVVCIQETWAGRPSYTRACIPHSAMETWIRMALTDHPGLPPQPCSILWADNTATDGNAGLAVICFAGPNGSPVTASHHRPHTSGRLQLVDIAWGGHSFLLANTYWPSDFAAHRSEFLSACLSPALTDSQLPICLLGDFNWVPDSAIDRRPEPSRSTAEGDASLSLAFSQAFPSLTDVATVRHNRTKFTYMSGGVVARLDRVYMTADLLPHCCDLAVRPGVRGTHHMLVAALLPVSPLQPRGPGRRPIPAHLPYHPPAAEELKAFSDRAIGYGMSLSAADLLAWWPVMLTAYTDLGRKLAAEQHRQQRAAVGMLGDAQAAAAAAMGVVETVPAASVPAAIDMAVAAQARSRRLHAAASAQPARADYCRLIRTREQPTPLITSMVHGKPAPQPIRGIRDRAGRLLTDNAQMARAMAEHFAAISTAQPRDPLAQQAVLQALRAAVAEGQRSPRTGVCSIPPHLADRAGASVITADEVAKALAHAQWNSATGPDGVPFTMWSLSVTEAGRPRFIWAPLLARLFSAASTEQRLPPGFTDGCITPLLKPAARDPAAPASYRPITLTNTVYRLLGRVLAVRFGEALSPSIGPEQCAFLPGRRIEDAINLADLLAQVVAHRGESAAAVFCDFEKAFDKVDRGFLFACMEAMGCSAGMLAWARLLLHSTSASAVVNGVVSAPVSSDAGVRQGCCLSPLLYLFPAQALASWLRHQRTADGRAALGITVGPTVHVSAHMADDTQVFLPDASHQSAAVLTGALSTFQQASGQAVNIGKSAVLLLGHEQQPAPAALGDIPVVAHHTSLGLVRHNVPPPPRPHAVRRYPLRSQDRPDPQPIPPEHPAAATAFQARVARAESRLSEVLRLPFSVMGHGLAASAYSFSTFLYHAEFRSLPLSAQAFVRSAYRRIGRGVPAVLLPGSPSQGGFGTLPVLEHVQARHAAMAARLMSYLQPAPAPGSPQPMLDSKPTPAWPEVAAFLLREVCVDLHPNHTMLTAAYSTAADVRNGLLALPTRQIYPVPVGILRDMAVAIQALGPLTSADSTVDARALVCASQPDPAFPRAELGALYWAPRGLQADPVHPIHGPAAVRSITNLLTAPAHTRRTQLHTRFEHLVRGDSQGVNEVVGEQPVRSCLQRAWRIACANVHKEPYWRAVVFATPGAGIPSSQWCCPSCGLGPQGASPISHVFWDCPATAAPIRSLLAASLGAPVSRAALWLMQAPPGVVQPVWDLVCLMSFYAMDYGRRLLWARQHAGSLPSRQQVVQASQAAFWVGLDEFVWAHHLLPSDWAGYRVSMAPGHPFISLDLHSDVLRLVRPPGAVQAGFDH
jgi:hypothetical protein